MKKCNYLYEICFGGLVALIYAKNKRGAIKAFKAWFRTFPFIDEIETLNWDREDWVDELGFEVTHMGSKPKDWMIDAEPILASLIYRPEV